MSKPIVWALWGVGVLAVIALLVVIFIFFSTPAEPSATATPGLPVASSTGPAAGSSTSTTTLTVSGKLGPVTMKDFLTNGLTAPDPQNPGTYYLAGSPGYCLTDGTCPHGAQVSGFNLTYDSQHQFFTVALLTEPLGATRTVAETFLENALGISQTQLCTLNYYVGTTDGVNEEYAGKNLGFSFCPNATVLP